VLATKVEQEELYVHMYATLQTVLRYLPIG